MIAYQYLLRLRNRSYKQRRSNLHLTLREGDELPKAGFVIHGDVGEDFSVEFDTRGFQPVYESAVGESV